MNPWISIEDLIEATSAKAISVNAQKFSGVGTDTRSDLNGKLFVALKGENHDAHDYLLQAIDKGAAGLLIHKDPLQMPIEWNQKLNSLKENISIFLVNDTLQSLQQLGQFRRRQWGGPLIAITGSNGKTTTKEFTAQLIKQYKNVHYNQGSFNNHWGLPLTLLELQSHHEVAICEMGMNHIGEISTLVKIAEPNIVGVTTVGRAHLEGLGSLKAVAQAKEEIYSLNTSQKNFLRIFNLDNEWTNEMYRRYSKILHSHLLTFSCENEEVDVHFQIKSMTFKYIDLIGVIKGVKNSAQIPVFGIQNKINLMFAACAALSVGLSPDQIWKALPHCKTIWGRNQIIHHPSGAEFLFDGYNANPDSQMALVENLKQLKTTQPLIGIFGEMKELGAQSELLHEELGQLVATAPFSKVFFVGNYGHNFKNGYQKQISLQSNCQTNLSIKNSESINQTVQLFTDVDSQLISLVESLLPEKPLITIKGSRGVKLERILKSLNLHQLS